MLKEGKMHEHHWYRTVRHGVECARCPGCGFVREACLDAQP